MRIIICRAYGLKNLRERALIGAEVAKCNDLLQVIGKSKGLGACKPPPSGFRADRHFVLLKNGFKIHIFALMDHLSFTVAPKSKRKLEL